VFPARAANAIGASWTLILVRPLLVHSSLAAAKQVLREVGQVHKGCTPAASWVAPAVDTMGPVETRQPHSLFPTVAGAPGRPALSAASQRPPASPWPLAITARCPYAAQRVVGSVDR
jgi:hypothetical protein